MKVKLLAITAATLAAAACASTPEEAPVPQSQPAVQAPPPSAQEGTGMDSAAISSAPLPGSIPDFVENAGDRVFFAYDSFTLSADARETLERQAAWLQSYPGTKILVAGNCDERGTREYNLALGARRANAAKDFLIGLGVDASRITTISYGKERPIDGRSNAQAWSLNRNAHTQIVSGGVS